MTDQTQSINKALALIAAFELIVIVVFGIWGIRDSQDQDDRLNRLEAQDRTYRIEELAELVSEDPDRVIRELQAYENAGDARIFLLKGDALTKLGEAEKAISSYETAISIAPSSAMAYLKLGVALTSNQRPDEALAVLQKARRLSSEPDSETLTHTRTEIILWLARAHTEIGETSEARELLLPIAEEHRDGLYYLTRARILEEEGDHFESIEEYTAAIRLSPDDASLYESLARAQYLSGVYNDALNTLRELQVIDREAFIELGSLCREVESKALEGSGDGASICPSAR